MVYKNKNNIETFQKYKIIVKLKVKNMFILMITELNIYS